MDHSGHSMLIFGLDINKVPLVLHQARMAVWKLLGVLITLFAVIFMPF